MRHCVGEMDTELGTLVKVNIQNKLKSDEFEREIYELSKENHQLKVDNEEVHDEKNYYPKTSLKDKEYKESLFLFFLIKHAWICFIGKSE